MEVVAVADPSPPARAAASARAGVDALSDPAALMARADVDAVVVCAPPAAHAGLAEASLAAGKHLYLEKPVGLELARARRLADDPGSGRVTAVGFSHRFNRAFAGLRRLVRGGEIGAVREVRCIHFEPGLAAAAPAWKSARAEGGGVALDLASHSVDMARWLLGEEIAAVEEAAIATTASEDDDLRARLRSRGGVPVELRSSYVRGRGHRWEVVGEGGVLVADRWPPRVRRRRRPTGGIGRAHRALLALPIPRREPSFALALGRFVAAARGELRGELATLDDGVRSLEAVLMIERAAGRGTGTA